MDSRFQSFIKAAVEQARADRKLLWADEMAFRIVSSSPLAVDASDIAEQLRNEAVRVGVAVTIARNEANGAAQSTCCA